MSSPFFLHVTINVAPENINLFLSHFKIVYDLVCAEPECLSFEVFQNPEVPGQFRFVEVWDASVEWFRGVQMNKEYYKPYTAGTEPLWTTPRKMEIWERLQGKEWVTIKKEFSERV